MSVLANMAHPAYSTPQDMENILGRFGAATRFYESRMDQNPVIHGRQAFLAILTDKAILAFRGAEGRKQFV